jgi:L-fuculose-phosphate aldolase
MEPTATPSSEQVREVVEAMRLQQTQELTPSAAASSPEAAALRAEIIKVGRKLWQRQYVDGNGGNISVRLGSQYLLCTPTLISKCDMAEDDIGLADLNGTILVGSRPRTSELLLHLEIYKANPQARAVVHCHPSCATAFAVTGSAPPNGYVTEFELMVGPVAVAPYDTPGTQAFAETVRPFVRDHNSILLTNHGVVCWSDTVTHAEWLVEILDTYCKTFLLAKQTGLPLKRIPDNKINELLAIKRRLGLPDERLASEPAPAAAVQANSHEVDQMLKQVIARLDGLS